MIRLSYAFPSTSSSAAISSYYVVLVRRPLLDGANASQGSSPESRSEEVPYRCPTSAGRPRPERHLLPRTRQRSRLWQMWKGRPAARSTLSRCPTSALFGKMWEGRNHLPLTSGVHSALYLSVPFCRTKCSFCNFSSGVVSRDLFDRYLAHLEQAIASAPAAGSIALPDPAPAAGSAALPDPAPAAFDPLLDSIYLGGGTPSVLAPHQLDRLFAAITKVFKVLPQAEITVEVAPGTLSAPVLAALLRAGVNRVSLGVQSFVDQESRSVGRLHNRDAAIADISRLRDAGITNLSIDLIAGLPHQTAESWERSLDQTLALELPHVSVYMLEVDADSRLGRELIPGLPR